MVRNNNRLLFSADVITVLTGKHVYLALVHSQLANISLQEKDVGALHARVEHLRARHIITFISSHNLSTAFNSRDVILPTNINDRRPVLLRSPVDFLRCPEELDIVEVHASSLPYLDKVATYNLNLLEFASHLIVE
jgi:hypothetical protein